MSHKVNATNVASDADDYAARQAAVRERGLAAALASFDPDRNLIYQPAAGDPSVRTYRQAASLPLALALLQQGAEQNDQTAIARATAIVSAVLESQERSPRHPHRGNWLWLADDDEVADINAVQFVLQGLLPVLVRYDHLLPAELVQDCREAVRLALEEEERMDVAPTFTNIHLMSLLALNVGGEWLDDPYFKELGRTRWDRWVQFTLNSGAPHEYNSTNYGFSNLTTLALFQELIQDDKLRLQAKLMYERCWLHALLHLHTPTRQLAGPHSRSYWGPMQTGRSPVKDLLWRETGWEWLLEPGPYGGDAEPPAALDLPSAHWLPSYLVPWLERQRNAMPFEVSETANRVQGADLTTYFTPGYALGTASATYRIGTDCFYIEHEANHLMLHYARPEKKGGWGMMYSRYVVNDRHWGTLGAAPDRPKDVNFYDQGNFAGVQRRNKAIGLYALEPQYEEIFSLKTIVAFPSGPDLDRVWLNDQAIDLDSDLPSPQPGDWLIVEDGLVYIGVHLLEQSCLGREAPIQFERGPLGELWLAIYNYRGAKKRFWEYASLGGAFWRGNLRAGFIVEVAERDEFASAADFLAHLRRSGIADETDDNHVRTVSYRSGEDDLAIRYDLWNTRPLERTLNGARYEPPHLCSPLAVQSDSGQVVAGSVTLYTDSQPVWLVAQELDPTTRSWTAVNPHMRPAPLRLETPVGVIGADAWDMGRITLSAPEGGDAILTVESLNPPAALTVPEDVRVVLETP